MGSCRNRGTASPLVGLERPPLGARFFPTALPDGRHFLFVQGTQAGGDLYLASLEGTQVRQPPRKLLGQVRANFAFVRGAEDSDTGYVFFIRAQDGTDTLQVQSLDLRHFELTRQPVQIVQQVMGVTASPAGILVYSIGSANTALGQLTLFDRQGTAIGHIRERGPYVSMAFSPDGQRVVASRWSAMAGTDLWMTDLDHGITTRFTFNSEDNVYPIWSADGSRIVFGSLRRAAASTVHQKLANGGGRDELLLSENHPVVPLSLSGDGHFLLIGEGEIADATSFLLPLDGNGHAAGKPALFVQKGLGVDLKFSPGPQGRPLWVAYSSNESGRYEVYVRPFDPNSANGSPPAAGKWQVSNDGGRGPRWSGDGRELFYLARDGTVTSVEVKAGATFEFSAPRPLFKPQGLAPQPPEEAFWDVSSDGRKFIFETSSSAAAATPRWRFVAALNWPVLLKR